MKILTVLIISFIFGLFTHTASAQLDALLQPFKTKAGLPMAVKSIDSSMTSAKLLGVFTLGDTSAAINLPIKIDFDIAKGQSKAWIYFFGGKSKVTGTDTVEAVAVVKVLLLGFQVLPFDVSALGQFTPFATALPDGWFDSDEMAAKIRANEVYKTFSANYPDKKPFLIPLSVAVVSQFFPSGSPLWQLNFGGGQPGGGTSNGPVLTCEVQAITGETKCDEVILSADELVVSSDNFAVVPNPVTEVAHFVIPQSMRGYEMTMSAVNAIGQTVFSTRAETSRAETVALPTAELSAGTYYLVCSANGRSAHSTFAVIK